MMNHKIGVGLKGNKIFVQNLDIFGVFVGENSALK